MSSASRDTQLAALRQIKTDFQKALQAFAASNDTFTIVQTVSSSSSQPPTSQQPLHGLRTLYVLDSSFNPPSHAHSTLARKAVLNDKGPRPCRVCLLLATENADKKPKPASFEDRLVMMSLMAKTLRSSIQQEAHLDVTVDIAITKKPFFMDKAASIDQAGVYSDAQQVHCTGYDTIIRIFNPKYYPADQKLRVLDPFLSRHRLRVCYRVADSKDEKMEGGGDWEEQDRYVAGIGDGSRESEGMKRDWRHMVELVDDAVDVRGVSSTKARKAAADGRIEDLVNLVGEDVAEYVTGERLYQEPAAVEKSYD